MDYKYIEQLLERYWNCETSLEEEGILRAFFSQKDIPAHLMKYAALFSYEHNETKTDVLGDDFDNKIMGLINEPVTVKARTASITQKLKPLFKAAAVVAIFLTLGNAAQVPFTDKEEQTGVMNTYNEVEKGTSVAMGDSAKIDTMKQSNIQQTDVPVLK